MKFLSLMTLVTLLSVTACSHMKKSCCEKKEATQCEKDKKCSGSSCDKTKTEEQKKK